MANVVGKNVTNISMFDHLQGRTDPMGIRAMPWGPPPKGAHQTSKNNANNKNLRQKWLNLQKKHCNEVVCGAPW